jgi:hypothetical protein
MNKKPMDDFLKEYYHLQDVVHDIDKRLLTIKGWGVTIGLAALTWGFVEAHYGLFLVAALSGLTFWILESTLKKQQMRFYTRIREIEIIAQKLSNLSLPDGTEIATPQIDWYWKNAPKYFSGSIQSSLPDPVRYSEYPPFEKTWRFPHVCLPHVITIVTGVILFFLGFLGVLGIPL